MRQSLKPGMSDEEKRRFERLMTDVSREIPPLTLREELAVRKVERDLERRAFAKLNPKPGMFADGWDAAKVLVPLAVACGALLGAIVWSVM